MTRRTTTTTLTKSVTGYFVHKTFSVYQEIGLNKWGRHRADVVAINHKSDIIITEVKSGHADVKADNKFHHYLPYCNKMYFCISHKHYNSKSYSYIKDKARDHGIGIMILCPNTGYIKVVVNAVRRDVCGEDIANIMVRLAWRGGVSKRQQPRRTRMYL